jgi:hypothetical protein
MGTDTNTGQQQALTVFGNPESFKKLINNHGQLCKIRQAMACPCITKNYGAPDIYCDACNGDGYIYSYQRNFLVVDENSPSCQNTITPWWNPIISVEKVENVTSEVQGGITEIPVVGFTDTVITVNQVVNEYEKKRVTYTFDGWTYVEEENLYVGADNGVMVATGAVFDSGYQSSNPLKASADIVQVERIWNNKTNLDLAPTGYSFHGNTISTSDPIDPNHMSIEYYSSDLTQVIMTDVANRNDSAVWTHELLSGETKMAFFPFWDIAVGDIIVLVSTILWKKEVFTRAKDEDKLWEIEIFELGNVILDEDGNKYYLDTDYALYDRYVKWLDSGSKPEVGKKCSLRYGYKPAYIVFEDNAQPNNAENKLYPKICLVKSWSKTNINEISKLMS